jgi:hypothetical protein
MNEVTIHVFFQVEGEDPEDVGQVTGNGFSDINGGLAALLRLLADEVDPAKAASA